MYLEVGDIDRMVDKVCNYDHVRDTLEQYGKDHEPGLLTLTFLGRESPSFELKHVYSLDYAVVTTADEGVMDHLWQTYTVHRSRNPGSDIASIYLDRDRIGDPTHEDTQQLAKVAEVTKEHLGNLEAFFPDMSRGMVTLDYGYNSSADEAVLAFAEEGFAVRLVRYEGEDRCSVLVGLTPPLTWS